MALVAQVITYPLTEGEVVAPANLGQPRDARAQGHSFFPGGRVENSHLIGDPGAWADKAHVPQQNVDEFRQFVQGGAAQQGAQDCCTFFVREQVPFLVPGIFHGFEFDDMKGFEAVPDALLQEEGRCPLDDGQQNSQNG